MEWRMIVGAAALGALALTLAFLSDRRARRRRDQASLPPDRVVPGFVNASAPMYLSAEAANTPPAGAPDQSLEAAEREKLTAGRSTPQLTSGWADPRFVTDDESGWAVLHDPLVVVVDEVGSVRELLPLVEKASAADRPLVVITGAIDADTLDTLAVNVVQRKRRALVVKHPAGDLRAAALDLGVDVVDRTSLQAGWCPPSSFEPVTVWVSSKSGSWFMR
ncbi:MAG TPA: hypothetical protein VFK68_10835 [Propionibacteriaceae bacterium]|nr:hypothetical protein [Propionibacteriaceae bacterium]